ncbi:MAG: hypothetical protein RBR44_03910 [Bacilli bacterium]|nr:hypothetical protein [Bacilli bacterium]
MKKSKKEILKNLRQEGSIITPDVLNNVYKAIGVDPTALGEKEKTIERRLQSEAEVFVPQNQVSVYAASEKPRLSLKTLFQKPRFVSIFATAMMAVILSVTLIGLRLGGFFVIDPTDSNTTTNPVTVPLPIENDQQVFSVGALSANVLFDAVEDAGGAGQFRALLNDTDVDIILSQFPPYLEMVEQLLSSDGELETISELSNREDYDFKETIVAYDLLGGNLNYIIYYNVETLVEEAAETQYSFNGIIIYGDSTDEYDIEGNRFIEGNETKIKMTIHYDENNYIESIYKIEDDGAKYDIRVFENNDIISSSRLKIETEEEETQLKLDFTNESGTYSYNIKFDEEDSNAMFVRYHINLEDDTPHQGTIKIKIIVDEETNEIEYEMVIKPNGEGQGTTHNENRGNGKGQGSGQGNNN